MNITFIYVEDQQLHEVSKHNIYRLPFTLPDNIMEHSALEDDLITLSNAMGEITCASIYATFNGLNWKQKPLVVQPSKECRTSFVNACILGFTDTAHSRYHKTRYLRIPFAIVPPFESIYYRPQKNRMALSKVLKMSLSAKTDEQREYMQHIDTIKSTLLKLLNSDAELQWKYSGFIPRYYDNSLVKIIQKQMKAAEKEERAAERKAKQQAEKVKRTGKIYFIQQGEDGPIKIGYSNNPEKRLQTLSTSSPYPLRLIKVIDGGKKLEQELHQRFADYRMEGEWFRPEPDLLAYIHD